MVLLFNNIMPPHSEDISKASVYLAALENCRDAMLVVDPEGYVLYYNQHFLDLWGHSEEEFAKGGKRPGIENALAQLVDPDRFLEPAKQAKLQPDMEIHDLHEFKDGRIMERISRPLQIGPDQQARLWMYLDVTETHRAQHLRDITNATLKAVFEKALMGILVVDGNQKVLEFNELYLEIFNMEADFLLNHPPDEVINYSSSQLKNSVEVQDDLYDLIKNPGKQGSSLLEFKDGRLVERFTESLMLPNDENGRVLFYRDISERVQRIQEVMDKTHELDRFVYSASHDMKSPLDALEGMLLLLAEEPQSRQGNLLLEWSMESLHKVKNHIHLLSKYSQNLHLKVRKIPLDLHDLLEDTWRELCEKEELREFVLHNLIPRKTNFVGDEFRVRIVLRELLANSISFRKPDSSQPEITVQFESDGTQNVVSFRDNGRGIKQGDHERIFELFYRGDSQSKGSGIGLYLARQAAQRTDWSLYCNPEFREGAEFRLVAPTN